MSDEQSVRELMGGQDRQPLSDHWSKRANQPKVVAKAGEDFRLTSAEAAELYLLAKEYGNLVKGFSKGVSWEEVSAVICLYLLKRDGHMGLYESRKEILDEYYGINAPTEKSMMSFRDLTAKVYKVLGLKEVKP